MLTVGELRKAMEGATDDMLVEIREKREHSIFFVKPPESSPVNEMAGEVIEEPKEPESPSESPTEA